jgi:hypothetical protein
MTRKTETREYSSPACFMHEAAAPKPEDWGEIKIARRHRAGRPCGVLALAPGCGDATR